MDGVICPKDEAAMLFKTHSDRLCTNCGRAGAAYWLTQNVGPFCAVCQQEIAHAAGWQALDNAKTLLREALITHDFNNPAAEYCWWCLADINGKAGPKKPHAEKCWGTRAAAQLTTTEQHRSHADD